MVLALSNCILQAIIAVFKTSHALETYVAQLYTTQCTSRGKVCHITKKHEEVP